MSGDEWSNVTEMVVKSWDKGMSAVEKLFSVAEPGAVYGEPIQAQDYTVITASEVMVGVGFGTGAGGGIGAEQAEGEAEGEEEEAEAQEGMGGGGGGGGGSHARPVAVVIAGSDGVRVEPVVDVTKLGLAFFTTLGSMFFLLAKMRKARRG